MSKSETLCGLIPVYNPGGIVREVIEETLSHVDHLIVIDDGCDVENKKTLERVCQHPEVTLITHPNNAGKGHALYTGLSHFLTRPESHVVMLDSDGQHQPDEITLFKQLIHKKPDFVMGVREEINQMPLKSKVGNVGMSLLFRLVTGKKLIDTQSGYRMLSKGFTVLFLKKCKPGRYETEMNMLFLAAKTQDEIEQVPISTTYIDNNSNSKFHPIRDSFRVLGTFTKFTGVSLLSFAVDYVLFLLFLALGLHFMPAHIGARISSGVFNFTLNKKWVFKNRDSVVMTSGKYLIAVVTSMSISSLLLWLLVSQIHLSAPVAKPLAELTTFLLNFLVIKHFVFKSNDVHS